MQYRMGKTERDQCFPMHEVWVGKDTHRPVLCPIAWGGV